MNTLNIILFTISAMLIIEGLILALFSKSIKKTLKNLKKHKKIREIGLIELMFALILVLIASFI